jgi:hypothetical protein
VGGRPRKVRTGNFSTRKCDCLCEEKFAVGFRGGFSLFLFAAEKERKKFLYRLITQSYL